MTPSTLLVLLTSVIASYYWQGQKVASGGDFNPYANTCAHKTLPFGTRVELERGGRTSWCIINDRGPFVKGRSLDMSLKVARDLDFTGVGVGPVNMTVAGRLVIPREVSDHVVKTAYKAPNKSKSRKAKGHNNNRVNKVERVQTNTPWVYVNHYRRSNTAITFSYLS